MLLIIIFIHWIVIYPVDGAIQRLNNPGANQIVGCVVILLASLSNHDEKGNDKIIGNAHTESQKF